MGKGRKMSTEEWIEKAKAVHGDKYDYSKVEYKGSHEKVIIICKEHGEFTQDAFSHLKGFGCKKCSGYATPSTEEWIKKAREIHGDKYDYSKVKYVNCKTKVRIICPKHGEFTQEASSHLSGCGCMECGREKTNDSQKLTTEEWVKKAREIHGNKYDYSKVNYTTAKDKVCIICPKHGEFMQEASSHLSGVGCSRCSRKKQLTTEEFIERAKRVHGDKYDYSKVKYVNAKTNVCIICKEHGEFETNPSHFLKGHGCPKCSGNARLTTEEFIEKAKAVHGDKYDYSKAEYIDAKTKVCIVCPIHGEFWQKPNNHLSGKGCKKCVNPNYGLTTEEFIEKAKAIHGNKYDYSKVKYVDSQTKVRIVCPIHGEFEQAADIHLGGHGCPYCNHGIPKQYKFNLLDEFESEYDLRAFLEKGDINILYILLSNLEPKFDPLKKDFEKALGDSETIDPLKALKDKYSSDSDDELDVETINGSSDEFAAATAPIIDLDDDDAIDALVATKVAEEKEPPTIEELIKDTEREIKVINKIEHLLTPEVRKYIVDKFTNDMYRLWMEKRETVQSV